MQNKQPKNDKGQKHGYWEVYYNKGNLWYKGEYLNGLEEGPFEVYYDNGQLGYKVTYKKGERIGYNQEYNPTGLIQEICFYAR